MVANVEKIRADIRAESERVKFDADKFRAETRAETRRSVVQAIVALAAAFGAGASVARFIVFRQ